ncbi:protealysin inhibitor emfourin [Pseudoduganella violaceinigra]|uniref:protealysin inhibitor emfourin n=1 Tax=Pseudoduganella violaceinigra TaxID=246602 RepID=UPI00041D8285|nr:protealysin inhibitor emfourin [Pseudoduganella violaceinigra]
MKITATGGGGFAGLSQHFEVDTDASPAGPALEAALASSGFFASNDHSQAVVGADLGHWTITVDDGRRRHSLSFVETGAPPWQHLLDLIRSAA